MTKTARNERRRITATALNNLAVSVVVTALVVPLVNFAYQAGYPQSGYWAVFGVIWITLGLGLHLIARLIVGRIEE